MDKKINYTTFDTASKKSLKDYEAPYNPVDWQQMESMLDAASKQITIGKSYSPTAIIAIISALVGILILLVFINAPSGDNKTTESKPIPEAKRPKSTWIKPAPAVKKDSIKPQPKTVVQPVVTPTPNAVSAAKPKEDVKPVTEPKTTKTEKQVVKTPVKAKETIAKEKSTKKESTPKKDVVRKKEDKTKKQKVIQKTETKEVKPAEETAEQHNLDEENDSNKNRQASQFSPESIAVMGNDTPKLPSEKSSSGKERKKSSKKDRRKSQAASPDANSPQAPVTNETKSTNDTLPK